MKNETEVSEAPDALCLCSGQANIQAIIRPGIWIPIIRSLHVYEEKWRVSANPIICSKDVISAVNKLRSRSLHGNIFTVGYVEEKTERSRVEIFVYTRCRNVYVIQLNFVNEESAGCVARVRAFSSGIFPSWFPLNFVFSSLFFFVPFYDMGKNACWINILRSQITIPLEIIKQGRKC